MKTQISATEACDLFCLDLHFAGHFSKNSQKEGPNMIFRTSSFFMFSLWILDVYLKILILTHFSPVKYFGKSKPTIWGRLKFFTSTSK